MTFVGRAARDTVHSLARVVALGSLFIGCHQPIPPPAATAPSMDRPSAAIPADLDVAIRIDLDAARRIFGPTVGQALQLNLVDPTEDVATAKLVSDALGRASAVWVAFRPAERTEATDNVLILRGQFGQLDPRASPGNAWGAPEDLGAAFRRYDRSSPKRRSAPARIYARADDWLVFVSTAELDSTERVVNRQIPDEHVDPPDQGLISLAARVPALVRALTPSYPAAAQAVEGASELEASATADDRGLRATLEVHFDAEGDVTVARDRVRLLLSVLARAQGLVGKVAKGAAAEAVGTTLVVKIDLDARAFSALVGCFTGASCD